MTLGAKGGTSKTNRVLTLAVVGELAIILILVVQVSSLMGPSGIKTVTRTTAIGPAGVDCLLPLPANTTVLRFSTQNFTGTNVIYPDGEQLVYPEYTCPQPVSNATATGPPGIPRYTTYQLALAAVTNKTFVADENDSTYLYSPPCTSYISGAISGTTVCFGGSVGPNLDLYFFNYGNQSEPGCSGGSSQRVIESGIDVRFTSLEPFAGTYVKTGVFNPSDPTFAMMSANEISLLNSCLGP